MADSPCVLTTSEYGWSANMERASFFSTGVIRWFRMYTNHSHWFVMWSFQNESIILFVFQSFQILHSALIHKYTLTMYRICMCYRHVHMCVYIYTYICVFNWYLPTYLPTYIHTYLHTYIHTYIHVNLMVPCVFTKVSWKHRRFVTIQWHPTWYPRRPWRWIPSTPSWWSWRYSKTIFCTPN